MAFVVNYDLRIPYHALPGLGLQPAVEVHLYYQGREQRVLGILDSGSPWTVFSQEIALGLGIVHVFEGDRVTANTFGGDTTFFQFDLEMGVTVGAINKRFPARVGFRPVHASRNILGRTVFFSNFQIGWRELAQEVFLSPE